MKSGFEKHPLDEKVDSSHFFYLSIYIHLHLIFSGKHKRSYFGPSEKGIFHPPFDVVLNCALSSLRAKNGKDHTSNISFSGFFSIRVNRFKDINFEEEKTYMTNAESQKDGRGILGEGPFFLFFLLFRIRREE